MTIWVVMPGGYDEYGPEGVYDSPEAAMAAYPDDTWEMGSDGNYSNGGSARSMGSLRLIERWPVKTLADVIGEEVEVAGVHCTCAEPWRDHARTCPICWLKGQA